MRVVIFGGTGKTGRHVNRAALGAGHSVTTFGRSVEQLEEPELHLFKGDVFDAGSVAAAVADHHAAIVCLGSAGLRDKTTLSAGTRIIVDSMVAHEVNRLVVMSAAGVADSWDQIPWPSRLLFRTMLRNLLADHTAQETIVKQSGLDWTIARAGVLRDHPATGAITATKTGPISRITRGDVAAFLVAQLDDPAHRQQAISITN